MEQSLEGVSPVHQQPKRTYSARNRLRREMVDDHPVYSLFVSGSSTGSNEKFFCRICHRDVSMRTRGAGEFSRYFFGLRHRYTDVTYRVREGRPVFNRLMNPWNCLLNRFLTCAPTRVKDSLRDSAFLKTCCRLVLVWTQKSLC